VTRTIRLRAWQKRALDQLSASSDPDFLTVATPGAGKTTFALTAARQFLGRRPHARIVVVCPTQHLKHQWADAAARFDLYLESEWAAADGRLPADVHGVICTYQQVATSHAALRAVADDGFVVLDEVHHTGEDRAWGSGVKAAFEPAARRLSLSGTPFRSDTQAIPFVRYELDEARADFEYGYGDALADGGVVRPVYFPRLGGEMEWVAPDGAELSASFDDPLDRARSGQRLRTALSVDGEWLPTVLRQAHEQLMALRTTTDPAAGGLVIAMDQDHARGIVRLLRDRLGVAAMVATSDDPDASARISRFAAGTEPWIVAVRMVSEGVDIPRLRVGVFATTTSTELFFRQAVGRLVRWQRGHGRQRSYLFIPDEARLRAHAHQIGDQRRHSLRKRDQERAEPEPAALDEVPQEQLSLFAAISATPIAGSGAPPPHHLGDDEADAGEGDLDDEGLTLELAPLPRWAGAAVDPAALGAADGNGGATVDRRGERRRLRDLNADRVAHLVASTGMSHAKVNAELNRLAGIRRITEASAAELERRLRHADQWLARR
jgi:superfamily II DNA or RNA helicase